MSKTTLPVLIVEGSEDDALLLSVLRRDGYDPLRQRVEARQAIRAELASDAWDVVLADYSLHIEESERECPQALTSKVGVGSTLVVELSLGSASDS